MFRFTWRKLSTIAAATVTVPLIIFVSTTISASVLNHEVKKQSVEIARLRMKPVCFGRFVIDVPNDATVSFRSAHVSAWDIHADADETDTEFRARLSKRETELRTANNERGKPSLEKVLPITAVDSFGSIFVYGRQWTYGFEKGKRVDDEFVNVDGHVHSRNASFDFSASYRDPDDAKELIKIVSQVRGLKANEIPSEAGFCFKRGIVLDPLAATQGETVTMFVGLNGHSDVSIAFTSVAGRTPPKTLLQRDEEAGATIDMVDRWRFTTLREGRREINGVIGEEVLEKVLEHNGTTGQSFMWESLHNDKTSVFSPFLTLEMSTGLGRPGAPVASTLSDATALALWEKITSSMRLRSAHAGTAAGFSSTDVPIGTLAVAGDRCPQSGWWPCTDGIGQADVSGRRVQYMRAGDQMPQALLLPSATPWQKLRGEQPTFRSEIPSSWKLMDRRRKPRGAASSVVAPAGGAQLPTSDETTRLETDLPSQQARPLVGAQLPTGASCTASGWWQCLEPEAFDGTRWFSSGALLPPATTPVSLTVLEKLKGVPGFVRVPTTWRLIRFANSETPVSTEGAVPSATSSSGRGKNESDLSRSG